MDQKNIPKVKNDEVELKEFINSTLDAIERGADLKHRNVEGFVDFEIKVVKTQKGSAGLKIYIASVGGEVNEQSIATVRFKVRTR